MSVLSAVLHHLLEGISSLSLFWTDLGGLRQVEDKFFRFCLKPELVNQGFCLNSEKLYPMRMSIFLKANAYHTAEVLPIIRSHKLWRKAYQRKPNCSRSY